MKTIILSDIYNDAESIIPYGLRVARALETEADVLHVIDTRVYQGNYSPVADSQSITPGDTFSQEEIIKREKNKAEIELDKMLSSEASRLNYPLKVNRLIRVNNIEEELEKQAKENNTSLFVLSSDAGSPLFETLDEIVSTVKNAGIVVLLVNPGLDFKDFEKVLMPVDFRPKQITVFNNIKYLFEKFDMKINAVSVANDSDYLNLEAEAGAWEQVAKDYFLDKSKLDVNVLKGKNFVETISSYAENNEYDLIIYFQKKGNLIHSLFKNSDLESLLAKTKIPVLTHFYK